MKKNYLFILIGLFLSCNISDAQVPRGVYANPAAFALNEVTLLSSEWTPQDYYSESGGDYDIFAILDSVRFVFEAKKEGGSYSVIANDTVGAIGWNSVHRSEITWQPPSSGDWYIRVKVAFDVDIEYIEYSPYYEDYWTESYTTTTAADSYAIVSTAVTPYPKGIHGLIQPALPSGVSDDASLTQAYANGLNELVVNAAFDVILSTSSSSSTTTYSYNSEDYYINNSAITYYDKHLITYGAANNAKVYVVLLNTANSIKPYKHPDGTPSTSSDPYGNCMARLVYPPYPELPYIEKIFPAWGAFRTDNADKWGKNLLKAIVTFMNERYKDTIEGFIVGNEIQNHFYYYNVGGHGLAPNIYMPDMKNDVIPEYEKAVRLVSEAISESSYNQDAKVFVSLDRNWNQNNGFPRDYYFTGKQFLIDFDAEVKKGTPYEWHVAHHPYPHNMEAAWNDSGSGSSFSFDADTVTLQNMHVLDQFLAQDNFLFNGAHKSIVLSEQSVFSSDPDAPTWTEATQAAGYFYMYKIAELTPNVDSMLYISHYDGTDWSGGLIDVNNQTKDSWDVFSDIDSADWANKTSIKQVKNTIGIDEWRELDPPVVKKISKPSTAVATYTQAYVGPSNDKIVKSFRIAGNNKKIALRALGSSLSRSGVSDRLGDPEVVVTKWTGSSWIAQFTVNNWYSELNASEKNEVYSYDLNLFKGNSIANNEVVAVRTLTPGLYQAEVRAKSTDYGVSRIELFELTDPHGSDSSHQIDHVSARSRTSQTSELRQKTGFSIMGSGTTNVYVNVVGPNLNGAGLDGLTDPKLVVYRITEDGSRTKIVENSRWEDAVTVKPLDDANGEPPNAVEPGYYLRLRQGNFEVEVETENGDTEGLVLASLYFIDDV